ncbi:MAG: TonB-dependent receptor [Bacteroidales bacterium]|nr:TonB-dependent receptor [Bacteroidales bacterium]
MGGRLALIMIVLMMSSGVVLAQQRVTVSGYVVDSKSSETIIGATVVDSRGHQGTVSNPYGFYSLTLQPGETRLTYSYVGYERKEVLLSLSRDTVINIRLDGKAEIEEVKVVGTRAEAGIRSTGMGSMDIPVSIIEHTPALLGETDVIKTLQLTPGVQAGSASSSFFVRGGGGDENLILLDGTPVYKIDHLFGFFSVFTPEAVKKVTFYKSSFPARYNGRTSSVVDVRTKDGDMHNYHATASIGLLTSRINVEGPIVEDKTSFTLSGRSTYFSLMTRPFMSKDSRFSYWFYDLNAKVNHIFSDDDRVYVSLYNGRDIFGSDYSDTYSGVGGEEVKEKYGSDLNWGNTISTIRWNHVFSSKVFSNATASYNHYRMKIESEDGSESRGGSSMSECEMGSEIIDWGIAYDIDYHPNSRHTVKVGSNYLYHVFKPQTTASRMKSTYEEERVDTTFNSTSNAIYAHELSVYAEDDIRVGALTVCPGMAWTIFGVQGKRFSQWQPRLSLRYAIDDDWTVKASYSQMSQCVHLLTSSPIAMPSDLWVPVTKDLKPEVSKQWSVGGYYSGIEGWELTAEAYLKKMRNVIEYKDGMSFMGFSADWDEMVALGEGRSYGIELMAKRSIGKATGWVSYTLAKSDRKFSRSSGVNAGERFPFTYDRRHTVNTIVSYAVTEKLTIDASWVFCSGATATISQTQEDVALPEGFTMTHDVNYSGRPYVSGRNNYRLPPSHCLSIGISHTKKKARYERTWNFSVYNAYNSMNPDMVYTAYEDWDTGESLSRPKLRKVTILPIIPSATYTIKF